MTRFLVCCAILMSLSACGGDGTNPFDDETEEETTATTTTTTDAGDDTGTDTQTDDTSAVSDTDTSADEEDEDDGEPIDSDSAVLPGTVNPTAGNAIFRREATSDGSGNGYAEGFSYDSENDTFTVDNLAFDGDSPYTVVLDENGDRFGMGPFSVFEAEAIAVDNLTSAEIEQLTYRALYAVAPDGNSSIAIVRTAAYVNYGFGGFIYQREGGVTLPTTGQAFYTGTNNYGGLRDFEGQGGLEYVRGDAEVSIDFDDFNSGDAVRGTISNRRIFDLAGDEVTADIIDAFDNDELTVLPELRFLINGGGVIDANGELTGQVGSQLGGNFSGNYYAVLSGENAQTITGIIVVTGADPRGDFTVRETGGFFAVRQ
ncbi:hypothetical protein [Planktotalea sp.]|uniref:hypothetical protein n=1 Tax=Planktotalea sp. TaxID=2029877 RepID=UPI003D6B249E